LSSRLYIDFHSTFVLQKARNPLRSVLFLFVLKLVNKESLCVDFFANIYACLSQAELKITQNDQNGIVPNVDVAIWLYTHIHTHTHTHTHARARALSLFAYDKIYLSENIKTMLSFCHYFTFFIS